MRVITNVQIKQVGGMARVFETVAAYAKRRSLPIEFIPLAVRSDPAGSMPLLWEPHITAGRNGWLLQLPEGFADRAIQRSGSIGDLREELAPLIAAYVERIRDARPDLVLVNGTYYRPWCLKVAAQSCNVPVVVHYHGSVAKEAEGSAVHALKLARAIEADFADPHARYIFPSALAAHQAGASFHLAPQQRHVIPNGVPDAFFAATGVRTPDSLGAVMRWEPVKNTAFMEALFVENEEIEHPYRISVISDLQPHQRDALTQPHLKFAPPRSAHALAAFYAATGAIICPSHFETFGNVAAEAVAAGAPALVSEHAGVAEVFRAVGLSRLIVAFTSPRQLLAELPPVIEGGVSQRERSALRAVLAEDAVAAQVCSVILQ